MILALSLPVASAQSISDPPPSLTLTGTIAEQPIVIGYARNISPRRTMEYLSRLARDISIGESFQEMLESNSVSDQFEAVEPKVDDPIYGFAMYMVSGLIPSFETISFQEVVDEADARRLVNGRVSQWGDNGSVEEAGNGCFRVLFRSVGTFDLPEGASLEQYTQSNTQNRGYSYISEVVENSDGKKVVQYSNTITSLFRLNESLLYEANFEELFTMALPGPDAVRSGLRDTADFGFNAYLDRIPAGIRQLGWSMLSAAAGSQLQQRDDESDVDYNVRRSSGDAGLAIVQSLLFDVDNADARGSFATREDPAVRGELRMRARSNSPLTRRLVEASGNSRFAPILSDDAAATVHLCVRLPEEIPDALRALKTWMTESARREYGSADAGMVAAIDSLADIVEGIAEHRTLEVLFKIGWTEASSGVLYGGVQLTEDQNTLKTLHDVWTRLSGEDPGTDKTLTLENLSGLDVIVIRTSDEGDQDIRETLGINVTHLYVAHANGCLWFAAGTENAHEVIRMSVAQCSENSRAARTPLVSGRLDIQRWLSYPPEDPTGVTQMLYWLDENAGWFPPTPLMLVFGDDVRPTPILSRVMNLGGDQQAAFSLETDESGLRLSVSLGEAIGNYILARMIDAQDGQLGRSASPEATPSESSVIEGEPVEAN